jgi:hypothetical protein
MVRKFLNGYDLFNTLALLRSGGLQTPFVVVEGEEDYDILAEHYDQTGLELVVGWGKPTVLEASNLAASNSFALAVFVIDADFDRITGKSSSYNAHVVATNLYDLSMDVHASRNALAERIVRIHSSITALDDRFAGQAKDAVDLAVSIAAVIGAARLVNEQQGWNIRTSRFPFEQLLGTRDEPTLVSKVVSVLELRFGAPLPNLALMTSEMLGVLTSVNHLQLVCGHDFFSALAAVCRVELDVRKTLDLEVDFAIAIDCPAFHPLAIANAVEARLNRFGVRGLHEAA